MGMLWSPQTLHCFTFFPPLEPHLASQSQSQSPRTMSSNPMVGQDAGTQRMVEEARENFPAKPVDGG